MMLAGPRKKQRITPNPRGNSWSKDENKYGQRLLEKMGWSQGKGLGAGENGVTEHVRVIRKDSTTGVGYTGCPDSWMSHHDDFNSILDSLNTTNSSSVPSADTTAPRDETSVSVSSVMNLAEKSQKSRSRLHYSKFTKSKDLSTKSVSDMNCVFGRRNPAPKDHNSASVTAMKEDCDEADRRFVKSQRSMSEYFAQKMKKAKSAENNSKCSVDSGSDDDDDGDDDNDDETLGDVETDKREDCLEDEITDGKLAEGELVDYNGDGEKGNDKMVNDVCDDSNNEKDCSRCLGGADAEVRRHPVGNKVQVKRRGKQSKRKSGQQIEDGLMNKNADEVNNSVDVDRIKDKSGNIIDNNSDVGPIKNGECRIKSYSSNSGSGSVDSNSRGIMKKKKKKSIR